MTDLKIGCRYRWTDGYLEEPVIIWVIGANDILIAWAGPEYEEDEMSWVPRDELEPLDD